MLEAKHKGLRMVFVEFDSDFPTRGQKFYMVGSSFETVLEDTRGGTRFGTANLSNPTIISEEKARELKLGFLEEGINAVQKRHCKGFKLDPPN